MVLGWVGDGVVQDQIDSIIDDVVVCVCCEFLCGESNKFCDECGELILEVC